MVNRKFDSNARVNDWLRDILLRSNNTRMLVAAHLGYKFPDNSEMLIWLSSAMKGWYNDGLGDVDRQLHQLSDGTLDSRDSILNPVES
jgi:hypothetical protein